MRSLLELDPEGQLRMHDAGEPGAGESRVFKVLGYLALSHGRPDAILIIAATGSSAVLISCLYGISVRGETVQSHFVTKSRPISKGNEKEVLW